MTEMTLKPSETPAGKPLKGWHVLLILLGFFGVIFTVNGIFLYHAITSFPGEDVKKSYLQGLNYNQTLAARAAQAETGWRAAAGYADGQVIFQLSDANDDPVSGLVIVAQLRRQASDAFDQTVAMTALTKGEYSAEFGALAQGEWHLRFTVMDTDAQSEIFCADKTLFVK